MTHPSSRHRCILNGVTYSATMHGRTRLYHTFRPQHFRFKPHFASCTILVVAMAASSAAVAAVSLGSKQGETEIHEAQPAAAESTMAASMENVSRGSKKGENKIIEVQLVRPGCSIRRELRCYSYNNVEGHCTWNMHLNSDGEVQFWSRGHPTPWHGAWQFDEKDNRMDITFSYIGDVRNMSTTVVFLCGDRMCGDEEIWTGRDSNQHCIMMRLLDHYRECTQCKCWHKA